MPFDPNDPDTKAAIKAAVEEANSALEAKRDELMEKLQKAKQELRAKSEINPAELEAIEKENEALKAKVAELDKTAKNATTAAEKATKALEAEQGATRRLLVENGLREALVAAGVTNAVHQKAAMAMLASGVEIVTEGDARVAKVGDKALADFAKEWAGSEEGKFFVAAPANTGGGATGGGGSGGGKVINQAGFDAMRPAERAAFFDAGGKIEAAA